MGRGGKRTGAGRPPKLEYEDRLWIHYRFKELRKEAIERKTLSRMDKEYQGTQIEELLEEMNNILPGENRKRVCELADLDDIPEPGLDLSEQVIEAAYALKGRKETLATRQQYFPSVRLSGETPAIRNQVADEATKRFGVKISPDYVKWIVDDRKGEFDFSD